jgi:hypothetical protein
MTKLIRKFQDYNKTLEKSKHQYHALLGKTEKVIIHPTRVGYCYARMADNLSELITVFNDKVAQVYNLPVIIERKRNKWYVVDRDTERYEDWGTSSSYLPKHASQHEFNRPYSIGNDIVYVYPDQFDPLLCYSPPRIY